MTKPEALRAVENYVRIVKETGAEGTPVNVRFLRELNGVYYFEFSMRYDDGFVSDPHEYGVFADGTILDVPT